MIFFQAILPLFVLMGMGYLLGRSRGSDPGSLSDVCIYILIPILMFASLVRAPLSGTEFLQLSVWSFGLVLVSWLGVSLVGRLLGWDRPTRSAVILSLSTVNTASYGLPVALFAFGDHALPFAGLLVVLNNITHSSFSVYIAAGGRQSPLASLLSVFRLPLIYAVVLALVLNVLSVQLPDWVLDVALLVGKAGPQLAIIVLGVQLCSLSFRGVAPSHFALGIAARSVAGPALGIGLTLLLGADGVVRDVLLLYSCLPAAISSLLLAAHHGTRPNLVGAIILGSTLISPITITTLLVIIGK